MDERAPVLLVIEDAEDQALLVGVTARHALPGLEVHIAADGRQGIDYLSGTALLADPPTHPTPDLVILDLMLPVVDGFGVLQWVRDHLSVPPPAVVVLSGSTDPDHESRARELGAVEVFVKPREVAELAATVREIVTRWIDPGDIIAAHMRSWG